MNSEAVLEVSDASRSRKSMIGDREASSWSILLELHSRARSRSGESNHGDEALTPEAQRRSGERVEGTVRRLRESSLFSFDLVVIRFHVVVEVGGCPEPEENPEKPGLARSEGYRPRAHRRPGTRS